MQDFGAAFSTVMGAFGFFAPGLHDIRKADPDDEKARRDLRLGLALAIGFSLMMAAGAAANSQNAAPYGYWLVAVAIMVLLYLRMMRDTEDIE